MAQTQAQFLAYTGAGVGPDASAGAGTAAGRDAGAHAAADTRFDGDLASNDPLQASWATAAHGHYHEHHEDDNRFPSAGMSDDFFDQSILGMGDQNWTMDGSAMFRHAHHHSSMHSNPALGEATLTNWAGAPSTYVNPALSDMDLSSMMGEATPMNANANSIYMNAMPLTTHANSLMVGQNSLYLHGNPLTMGGDSTWMDVNAMGIEPSPMLPNIPFSPANGNMHSDLEEFDEFLRSMFTSEMLPLNEQLNRIPPVNPVITAAAINGTAQSHTVGDSVSPQALSDSVSSRTLSQFVSPKPPGSASGGGEAVVPSPLDLSYVDNNTYEFGAHDFRNDNSAFPLAVRSPGSLQQKQVEKSSSPSLGSSPQSQISSTKSTGKVPHTNKVARPSERAIHRFDPRSFSFDTAVSKFQSKDAPVRKAYDPDRRREVAKRRDVGACFTCRMWKVTCRQVEGREDEPCERCSSRFTEGETGRTQFCFRVNLQDMGLFRLRSPLFKRSARSDITWVTTTTVTLDINLTTHYKSDPYRAVCRHFKPHNDDIVVKYVGNASGAIAIPSYAIVDLEDYKSQLPIIFKGLREVFLEEKIDKGCDEGTLRSLRTAFAYADRHPDSMLNVALNIWVGSKLCATEKSLTGVEILGLSVVQEPGHLLDRLIPVPPKIDHQMDTVVIEWMCEIAPGLMSALARKLIAKKKGDWFEVFLTILVIMNNIEYVYGMQKEFMLGWYTPALKDHIHAPVCIAACQLWMEEWQWSAKKILHVYRTYFRKKFPFTKGTIEKAAGEAGICDEERAYLIRMIELKGKPHFHQTRNGDPAWPFSD